MQPHYGLDACGSDLIDSYMTAMWGRLFKLVVSDWHQLSCLCAAQLAQTKAAEIDGLLQRLSDVNDEMGSVIGGFSDARSHTLARHRDILQEFTQVWTAVGPHAIPACCMSA